jgi:hypothetical protein
VGEVRNPAREIPLPGGLAVARLIR